MKAGLFIPCYVDAFFPDVGIATLQLLERLGHRSGLSARSNMLRSADGEQRVSKGCGWRRGIVRRELQGVRPHRYPVGELRPPRARASRCNPPNTQVEKVRRSTYELVEFLHDVVKVDAFPWAEFPHKVGLHNSCTTLRKLRTAKASEIDEPFFSNR